VMREISPDQALVDLFELKGRLDEAKRAVRLGLGIEHVPVAARHLVLEVRERFAGGNPSHIDRRLDMYLFDTALKVARSSRSELLERIWDAMADMANLSITFRLKARKATGIQGFLVGPGRVPFSVFEEAFGETWERATAPFAMGPLASVAFRWADGYMRSGSFKEGEKASDDMITSIAREAKLIAMGPEVLSAYILARMVEAKNLRIILIGKSHGMPKAAIQERLREPYV